MMNIVWYSVGILSKGFAERILCSLLISHRKNQACCVPKAGWLFPQWTQYRICIKDAFTSDQNYSLIVISYKFESLAMMRILQFPFDLFLDKQLLK